MLDALGNRTRCDDDNLHRWTKITDALGAITQFRRDANGNLTRYTYYPKNTASLRDE